MAVFALLGTGALSVLRSAAPWDEEGWVVTIDPGAVDAITLADPSGRLVLRRIDGRWYVDHSLRLLADQSRVELLLRSYGQPWQPAAVLGGDRDASLRAVVHGEHAIQLEAEFLVDESMQLGLEVGPPHPAGGRSLRIARHRTIYRAHLPAEDLLLDTHLERWLDPSFVAFAPDDLVHLSVRSARGAAQVAWERDDFVWEALEGGVARTVPDEEMRELRHRCAGWPRAPHTSAELDALRPSLAQPTLSVVAHTESRGRFALQAGAQTSDGRRIVQIGDGPPTLVSARVLDVFERIAL